MTSLPGSTGLVPCDSCGSPFRRVEGYCLTTSNVAISEAYWRHHFAILTSAAKGQGPHQLAGMFSAATAQVAGSADPWMICEGCSEYFMFDRTAARAHASRGTVPEESGAVSPDGCAQFAAAAWEHVNGRWPASVQRPLVDGTCDFCAKKIYQGEFAGSISEETTARYLAAGVLATPPLAPSRHDKDGWVTCMVCMNRVAARMELR